MPFYPHDLKAGVDVVSRDGHKLGTLHRVVLRRSDLSLTHVVVDIGFLRSGHRLWEGGLGLDSGARLVDHGFCPPGIHDERAYAGGALQADGAEADPMARAPRTIDSVRAVEDSGGAQNCRKLWVSSAVIVKWDLPKVALCGLSQGGHARCWSERMVENGRSGHGENVVADPPPLSRVDS